MYVLNASDLHLPLRLRRRVERLLFPVAVALFTLVGPASIGVQEVASAQSSLVVTIFPGDSIQNAVDGAAPGTVFLIKKGIHRRQTVYPKSGMTFVGETGAVLDGEKATPQAFVAAANVNDVTIRGLRITGYAPPDSSAAVEGYGSSGWVVEGNEIDYNGNAAARTYGIRIGSRWVLRSNRIHHNGWVGIAGYRAFDTLIEGNNLYTNPATFFTDTVGEAANIKLYACGRITLRGNWVHDGPAVGIWLDTSEPNMTVERNWVADHGDVGIWYEVSYQGVIRDNNVQNAGYRKRYISGWAEGAGIQVTNSPDVEVTGNIVTNSLNGILGQQAQGYGSGAFGANELRNFLVKGNTVVMPKGQTGVVQNIGSSGPYLQWNNRFEQNRYVVAGNAKPFRWMDQSLDELQWQSYGDAPGASFAR